MKEFKIIDKFFKPLAAGLGDDCIWFDGYCVTKDVLISGVHFFAGDAPYNLARKALRVNLSDLASSGAKPFGFMLGLALPKSTKEKWLEEFALGLKDDIKKYKFQMLGGDTCFHEGGLVISVTAIGKATKPILRSGARVGDNIFVSGKIGGGWLGLEAKKQGVKQGKLVKKYELPEPRVDICIKLRQLATACIDISDGLLADMGHICKESGVGAAICLDDIPLFDAAADLGKQITGGDDYELLFTSPKAKIAGCYKIGHVTAGKTLLLDGKPVKAKGYEHNTTSR